MPSHVAQVTAASTHRGLVPGAQALPDRLRQLPVLLLWDRQIEMAVAEAKMTRFGEPTDTAILAMWWIQQPDDLGPKGAESRMTFERACLLLGQDAVTTRARLVQQIEESWRTAALRYAATRLELRTRAVLAVAQASPRRDGCHEMGMALALLLVSDAEYEDTAGINRADPPGRVRVRKGA